MRDYSTHRCTILDTYGVLVVQLGALHPMVAPLGAPLLRRVRRPVVRRLELPVRDGPCCCVDTQQAVPELCVLFNF